MNAPMRSALFLAAALLAACASDPRPAAPDVLVLEDGAVLAGYVAAPVIRVPSGSIVHVAGPLELHAARRLVVDGELRARDAAQRTDGPPIVLRAGERLAIHGRVLGGRGQGFGARVARDAGRRGGDGSDVFLIAPQVVVTGLVRGGRGGDGGAGGDGGRGGSVSIAGALDVGTGAPLAPGDDATSYARFEAGIGGLGGPPPSGARAAGVAGAGGRVVWALDAGAFAVPERPR